MDHSFQLFGTTHVIAATLTFSTILVILHELRSVTSERQQRQVRSGFAVAMILDVGVFTAVLIYNQEFTPQNDLPVDFLLEANYLYFRLKMFCL